jgi:hypothetical protein
MRRVRLLVWKLFRGTPLDLRIDQNAEMDAAAAIGVTWDQYLDLRRQHPDLWAKWAAKRELAKVNGWPPQPPQLRRHRKKTAPVARKEFRRRLRQALPDHMRGLPTDMKIAVLGMEILGM